MKVKLLAQIEEAKNQSSAKEEIEFLKKEKSDTEA